MTNLEIVNRALTSLGALPAASMSDTSKPQARAITAYTLCRDEMLRKIPWPSVVTRALMKNMDDQAQPWVASTAYLLGQRVTNDTDKTYRCTTAGTSASSGGPTGTGSGILDGTCYWEYVEASTAANNWAHRGSTAYVVNDLVISANNVYKCITAGTTAAATPPTTTSKDITDGTAHWFYYGTPPYNRTVYAYQYIIPPDCLRALKIPNLSAVAETDEGMQYRREGNWLYCDQDASFLLYIVKQEDPDLWDALLQETVAMKIAAEIAYDVTGQKDLAVLAHQKFALALADAHAVAMAEGVEAPPEEALWVDA